jgi:hypothetical protein
MSAMPKQHLGALPSGTTDGDVLIERRGAGTVRRVAVGRRSTDAPAPTEQDQLARDIADIERAATALRKAQPSLEAWTTALTEDDRKPRPVWLIIGILWLSTALLAAGAAVAIAMLAR